MLLEEDRPTRGILNYWTNCLLALTLGLFVCISDIRLSGDLEQAVNDPDSETVAGVFAYSDFFTGEMEDVRVVDEVPIGPFSPPGELVLLPYDRIIHEAAGRYDIDADLIAAVIITESQFDPYAVSKKGAKGLMQIMPGTAAALNLTNVYSPEENIHGGSRHLKWLLGLFDGNIRLTLAAYNAGEQSVLTYKGVPPYPETEAYVIKAMECYRAIKDSSKNF